MNITSAHASAMLAFTLWGLLPLYWKIFNNVSSWDLFGHRLLWSFFTLIGILLFKKKLVSLKEIWKTPRSRYLLMLSALFISSNWLIYIYAVHVGRVIEASMGYFLSPLINVLMGWLILREKVRSTQWPSIILATIAIVFIAVQTDFSHFPWIALSLSLTFAFYGLIRKLTPVGSMEGLAFETSMMILPLFILWHFQPSTPATIFGLLPLWKILVLSLSGVVTCVPLILFAFSAKRLQLQTLGFIQYLSPSFKFLCGLFILHEPLSPERLQAFFMIWIALCWYTIESYYFMRKGKKLAPVVTE